MPIESPDISQNIANRQVALSKSVVRDTSTASSAIKLKNMGAKSGSTPAPEISAKLAVLVRVILLSSMSIPFSIMTVSIPV